MALFVELFETEKHKRQVVTVIEYGYERRGKEYIKCKERRGCLIIGTHCSWGNTGFENGNLADVSLCTCGTEEFSEKELRADNMWYCSKCGNAF